MPEHRSIFLFSVNFSVKVEQIKRRKRLNKIIRMDSKKNPVSEFLVVLTGLLRGTRREEA